MASAGGKKRIYRDNTVKGKRRGSKWPAEIKTAALCDLLVNNNLSQVAARYGVPESTLRTWETEARQKAHRKSGISLPRRGPRGFGRSITWQPPALGPA